MSTLKELFTENCTPSITLKALQDLDRFVAQYEVRDLNPMAFNTPMLGVQKAYWYVKDSETIFSIFNIDMKTMDDCIKRCSSVNKSFNVISNPFNNLIIWLIYCLRHTNSISKPAIYNGCLNLLKCLHYHFFTGKVNQLFQYNANEGVMLYTIDNLTDKSDIKNEETNTWKKLIYKHCVSTLENNPIYNNSFNNFTPDSAIGKSISDIHTRLCRKLVLISSIYYENNKNGKRISESSIIGEDAETGKAALGDLKGTLDIVINRICTAALNINEFIDQDLANLAARLTSNIRKDNVIEVLTLFSSIATQQVKDKTLRDTRVDKNRQPIYKGYAILLEELVQKTYRRAALMGVDMKSNVAILNATKNTYTASRVIDNDIGIIKNSIDDFMTQTKYTRAGTLISLRVAFVIYIILLSFKYH